MTTTPLQDYLDQVQDLICRHGYAVQHGGMGFSYTVGLSARTMPASVTANPGARFPELVVVGLEPSVAHTVLNDVARSLLNGSLVLNEGVNYDKIFDRFNARFAKLEPDVAYRCLKVARALYGPAAPFEAWQLMWPDPNGTFPGEAGVNASVESPQNLALVAAIPILGTFH